MFIASKSSLYKGQLPELQHLSLDSYSGVSDLVILFVYKLYLKSTKHTLHDCSTAP